jgi:hypothetical protein
VASTRSLTILAGVTALLVLALVWDVARPGRDLTPGSRRLVPACDSVARVVWERPGEAPVVLERKYGLPSELRVARQPPAGELRVPADEHVVDDLLGTLELLSPRRALPASRAERGLDPPRLRIHVRCQGGRTTTLALGHRITAMDRVWLARLDADTDQPGTDHLIEGHAARALDRSLDDLRARRVFAGLAASLTPDGLSGDADIELRQGSRALALLDRHTILDLDAEPAPLARADLGQLSALVRRLRDLVIVRFVDDAPGAPGGRAEAGHAGLLTIRAHDTDNLAATLEELGPCPPPAPAAAPAAPGGAPASPSPASPDGAPAGSRDLRLVRTHLGTGCVEADALTAVAAFLDEPQRMIARTLLEQAGPWERVRVHGGDGVTFTLEPRGGDVAMVVDYQSHGSELLTADRAAVDEWLAALAAVTGGAIVPMAELDQSSELAFSVIVAQSGVEHLVEVYRDLRRDPRPSGAAPRWLALRDGEPILLVIDTDLHAAGVLPVEPMRFLPRTLLVREPFALREVSAHEHGRVSEHLARGELLDDWAARAPARASARPGIIDALRQTVARLRAVRFVAEAPAPSHRLTPPRRRIEAVFDPGPLDADVPIRDRVDIGADTPGGCLARLDTGRPSPVFELDRRTCDTLLGPWTSRGAP